MYRDVEGFVRTCPECQLNKLPTNKPAGYAHTIPLPTQPWQSIAIDFIGPITESKGYRYILSMVDRFSGFLLCTPMPNNFSAITVADIFIREIYGRYGLPDSIVSDWDARFMGKFWQKLQESLGTKLLMSTAFHQETNGQVERVGKDIMQTLRIYTNNKGADWADNLWCAERMHNTAKSSGHYLSPYEMVYGHPARKIPTELPQSKIPAVEGYLNDLICYNQEASDTLILGRA